MTDETYVTRRELDLLKAEADRDRAKMWARIEGLDEHGPRGTVALQVRMDNMVTELAELKAEVNTRFDAHEREHEKDESRRSRNRWALAGLVVALVASIDGPVLTVVLTRGR